MIGAFFVDNSKFNIFGSLNLIFKISDNDIDNISASDFFKYFK